MLKGVNDSLDDARQLVRLLKGIPAKINLIPFNPWPGSAYECSDWDQIEKFSEYVFNAGYSSPVRTPRGRDILAACGQLKSETEKLSVRERQALRAMAMTDSESTKPISVILRGRKPQRFLASWPGIVVRRTASNRSLMSRPSRSGRSACPKRDHRQARVMTMRRGCRPEQ